SSGMPFSPRPNATSAVGSPGWSISAASPAATSMAASAAAAASTPPPTRSTSRPSSFRTAGGSPSSAAGLAALHSRLSCATFGTAPAGSSMRCCRRITTLPTATISISTAVLSAPAVERLPRRNRAPDPLRVYAGRCGRGGAEMVDGALGHRSNLLGWPGRSRAAAAVASVPEWSGLTRGGGVADRNARHAAGEDPDTELVRLAGEGDAHACAALVDRHLPRILGMAVRMLGNRAEAEDVAQEVFLRTWRHAPDWK